MCSSCMHRDMRLYAFLCSRTRRWEQTIDCLPLRPSAILPCSRASHWTRGLPFGKAGWPVSAERDLFYSLQPPVLGFSHASFVGSGGSNSALFQTDPSSHLSSMECRAYPCEFPWEFFETSILIITTAIVEFLPYHSPGLIELTDSACKEQAVFKRARKLLTSFKRNSLKWEKQ